MTMKPYKHFGAYVSTTLVVDMLDRFKRKMSVRYKELYAGYCLRPQLDFAVKKRWLHTLYYCSA